MPPNSLSGSVYRICFFLYFNIDGDLLEVCDEYHILPIRHHQYSKKVKFTTKTILDSFHICISVQILSDIAYFNSRNLRNHKMFETRNESLACDNAGVIRRRWRKTIGGRQHRSCCGLSGSSVLDFGFQIDSLIYVYI